MNKVFRLGLAVFSICLGLAGWHLVNAFTAHTTVTPTTEPSPPVRYSSRIVNMNYIEGFQLYFDVQDIHTGAIHIVALDHVTPGISSIGMDEIRRQVDKLKNGEILVVSHTDKPWAQFDKVALKIIDVNGVHTDLAELFVSQGLMTLNKDCITTVNSRSIACIALSSAQDLAKTKKLGVWGENDNRRK